jgi:hypothetical protein
MILTAAPPRPNLDLLLEAPPAIHDYVQVSNFWIENKTILPSTPNVSSFWEKERAFYGLVLAAQRAESFEQGWDGYDAPKPSGAAVNLGVQLLIRLKDAGLRPYSVLPSADGGIGISFRGKQGRRAVLEILNDGTSSYVIYGKGHPTLSAPFDVATPDLKPVFTLLSENL